jgi:hypothetical protein
LSNIRRAFIQSLGGLSIHSFRCIARYYGYQRIFFYRTQRLLLHESIRHIFAPGCLETVRVNAVVVTSSDRALHDVFNGTFAKFIYAYMQRMYNTVASISVEFLLETINLRDGLLVLPDNSLTFNEINDIIDFICTT